MEFAKKTETGWDDFIKALVKNTRRDTCLKSTDDTPASEDLDPEELAEKSAKACAKWATRIPHLKPGEEDSIEARIEEKAKERILRAIKRYQDDGLADDAIIREVKADISMVGRGSPKRSKGSPKRSKYAPITQYPADRAMAIKNLAPATGVAWWPLEPALRIQQV